VVAAALSSVCVAAPLVVFDRITPPSGAANALVWNNSPIATSSSTLSAQGYVGTIEFSTPPGGVRLTSVRMAVGTVGLLQPGAMLYRLMLWDDFGAALSTWPSSAGSMYLGNVASWSIPGSDITSGAFGTHAYNGPIFDVTIPLPASQRPTLAGARSFVLGFTLSEANTGVMETDQTGPSDRGLSPFYLPSGWRAMNTFDGLVTGRYAVALWGEALCPGDLNSDNQVDDADFVLFAGAYNLLDCADPAMPSGCPADLNTDRFVDDADFVLFATAYNELVCP
jgi:hypothetical protein